MRQQDLRQQETFRLTEYAQIVVALPEQDRDYLAHRMQRVVEVTPNGMLTQLTARQTVGIIPLPSGNTLEILPKLALPRWFSLLARAYGLAREQAAPPRDILSGLAGLKWLTEWLLAYFCDACERVVRLGLVSKTEQVESQGQFLRGKVNLAKATQRPLYRPLLTTVDHITLDNVENQVLKAALEVCLGQALSIHSPTSGRLKDRLNRLKPFFSTIQVDVQRLTQVLGDATLTPPPHYREAFQIARLLLQQQLPLQTRGQMMFTPCLFNTEQVYERYIIEISKRISTAESHVMIQPEWILDEANTIRIRPDVVLQRGNQVEAIIDAKYKASTTSADLYQMLAYCHRLACPLGILVIPSSGQKQVRIQARDQSIITIHTIGIGIDRTEVDLNQLEQQFLSSVGELLAIKGSCDPQ